MENLASADEGMQKAWGKSTGGRTPDPVATSCSCAPCTPLEQTGLVWSRAHGHLRRLPRMASAALCRRYCKLGNDSCLSVSVSAVLPTAALPTAARLVWSGGWRALRRTASVAHVLAFLHPCPAMLPRARRCAHGTRAPVVAPWAVYAYAREIWPSAAYNNLDPDTLPVLVPRCPARCHLRDAHRVVGTFPPHVSLSFAYVEHAMPRSQRARARRTHAPQAPAPADPSTQRVARDPAPRSPLQPEHPAKHTHTHAHTHTHTRALSIQAFV